MKKILFFFILSFNKMGKKMSKRSASRKRSVDLSSKQLKCIEPGAPVLSVLTKVQKHKRKSLLKNKKIKC